MVGLTENTYTVEPREPVILTPYIEPIASEGEQDGNTLRIKDHIGAKVLLNFGLENGNLHECTISHLSQNERAVFMIFEGDAHNRWLTIEKFNQLFFDFIAKRINMEGQAPTRERITKHLIAVGFEQKGVSYFRMGPIEVKLVDEDGIGFSVFDSKTALNLCAFADISATYLFESSEE